MKIHEILKTLLKSFNQRTFYIDTVCFKNKKYLESFDFFFQSTDHFKINDSVLY